MPAKALSVLFVLLAPLLAPAVAAAESLGVSPAAFLANSVFVDTQLIGSAGYRESGDTGCEYAPVQLPHGVVLNSLVFWVHDDVSGAGNDLAVRLWEKNTTLDTTAVVVLEGTSSGSSSTIHAIIGLPPAGPHNVNTTDETFYLEACYGAGNLELHHVEINYSGPPSGIDTGSPAVIPPAAFRSLNGRPAQLNTSGGYVFASFLNGGPPNDCLVAPVILPDGTNIQSVQATLYDQRADSNVHLQLRRKRLGTNLASEVLATVSTAGASSAPQQVSTSAVSHPRVHHAYEYFLATAGDCPVTDTTQRIYAVRIHHTPSLFADGFESGDTSAWSAVARLGGGAPLGGGTRRLQLPAAAFLPQRTGSFFTQHEVDVVQARLRLSAPACSFAPVTLPNGSSLILLAAWLFDSDPSRDLTLRLWAKNDNLPFANELANVSSSGASGPTLALAVLSGNVNTQQNHYYLEVCRPSGSGPDSFGVQTVSIDYSPP